MRQRSRRIGAAFAAATTAAATLLVLVSAAPGAGLTATGGAGRLGPAIDWIEWGDHGETLNASGISSEVRTSTTQLGDAELAVTCAVGGAIRTGGGTPGLTAYASGSATGDALDDLYDVGGAATSIATTGQEVTFDLACGATLDGNPYPVHGIVIGDGERTDGPAEFISATVVDSATWRLVDRHRSPGCSNDGQVAHASGGGLELLALLNVAGTTCASGPAGVALANGATEAVVTIAGGGTAAVAIGVAVAFDHGDAPASYGDAVHALQYEFTGGDMADGLHDLFGDLTLASAAAPTPTLGTTVDPDAAPVAGEDDATGAAAFGPADDETEHLPASLTVVSGDPVEHTVTCTGDGGITGWIDFNINGTFDDSEDSAPVVCDGGAATLTWTVPGDLAHGATFARIRIASADESQHATSFNPDGEVEDFAIDLFDVPTVAITAPPDGTVYAVGDVATGAYECAGGAPPLACTATIMLPDGTSAPYASGDPLPTDQPGTHTITATATDANDASATAVSTYVVAAPGACAEDGLALLAPSGLASGLVHQLEAALGPLGLDAVVHGVNCGAVVPLEDLVDSLLGL